MSNESPCTECTVAVELIHIGKTGVVGIGDRFETVEGQACVLCALGYRRRFHIHVVSVVKLAKPSLLFETGHHLHGYQGPTGASGLVALFRLRVDHRGWLDYFSRTHFSVQSASPARRYQRAEIADRQGCLDRDGGKLASHSGIDDHGRFVLVYLHTPVGKKFQRLHSAHEWMYLAEHSGDDRDSQHQTAAPAMLCSGL